ncbi:MAG: ATP-binding protein [Candidatus Cloacimonetes bacterium]|nr:ATP-binding protein [Candidatus Cloacimonadota bacterium]
MQYPADILFRVINLKSQIKPPKGKKRDSSTDESDGIKNKVSPELATEIGLFLSLPAFLQYNLSQNDVILIAALWQKQLDNFSNTYGWKTIIEGSGTDISDTQACIALIEDLLERSIIVFAENGSTDYYLNPILLLSERYVLSRELILRILGRDLRLEIEKMLSKPWNNNTEFFYELNLCLDTIFKCLSGSCRKDNLNDSMNAKMFLLYFQPFINKIPLAKTNLIIKETVDKLRLSQMETVMVLLILYVQTYREDYVTEKELLRLLSSTPAEYKENAVILRPSAKLLRENIISLNTDLIFGKQREFLIPESLRKKLCGEHENDEAHDIDYYLKQSNALQLVSTTQTLSELIIPLEQKELLENIQRKYDDNSQSTLQSWGFDQGMIKGVFSSKGTIILFYGAPGTGKTFAAGALANSMQKQLIPLDCTALRDSYYGESEKKVKKAFVLMRTMAENMGNCPVFLINEADQLIHRRQASHQFSLRTENSLQNIMLEEMENFPGILILTTNLEENIDEAYFRRFDFKIRFTLPDAACQRKLWQQYLYKSIPGSDEINVDYLIRDYSFSGGQIAMIIRNACSEAINRPAPFRKLTQSDIDKYAGLENPWSGMSRKSIGF